MKAFLGAYFLVTGLVVAGTAVLDLYRFFLWGWWAKPLDWEDRVRMAVIGGLILVVAGLVCLAWPRVGLLLSPGGFVLPWWFYGPHLTERGWWAGFEVYNLVVLVPPVLLLGIPIVGCVGGWRFFRKREAPS